MAVCLRDLWGSGAECVDGSCSGVDGDDKGDAGAGKIVCVGHYNGKMAISAATASGVDGARIGIKFLL